MSETSTPADRPMWWGGIVHISQDEGATGLCGVRRQDPQPAVIATGPGCAECLRIAEAGPPASRECPTCGAAPGWPCERLNGGGVLHDWHPTRG